MAPTTMSPAASVTVTRTVPNCICASAFDISEAKQATLANKLTGYRQSSSTDERGVVIFNNVPFDDYALEIEAPRFQRATRGINVRSNIPIDIEIKLAVPGSQETTNVEAASGLIERDSTSSRSRFQLLQPDLVDFGRERVKPWTLLGVSTGAELFRKERVGLSVQFDVLNLANKRFAYNFGNPFEGTHFGYPRQWSARVRLTFR